MQKLGDVLNNFDSTLVRRRHMYANLERAHKEAPDEMRELLAVIMKTYQSGSITNYWDVLANLAGAERGFGNHWFFNAVEMLKKEKI